MYRVTDDLRVRFSYGQGFRAPDFKNLYLDFTNVTAGYQVLGNPSLQPESSHSWNIGAEYQVLDSLLGRIHVYRNDLHNLIEAERIGQSAAGGSNLNTKTSVKPSQRGLMLKPLSEVWVGLLRRSVTLTSEARIRKLGSRC